MIGITIGWGCAKDWIGWIVWNDWTPWMLWNSCSDWDEVSPIFKLAFVMPLEITWRCIPGSFTTAILPHAHTAVVDAWIGRCPATPAACVVSVAGQKS